jgi:hypothetical protein
LIDKTQLKIKELEHVLIEKVAQLFRDMLTASEWLNRSRLGQPRVIKAVTRIAAFQGAIIVRSGRRRADDIGE